MTMAAMTLASVEVSGGRGYSTSAVGRCTGFGDRCDPGSKESGLM